MAATRASGTGERESIAILRGERPGVPNSSVTSWLSLPGDDVSSAAGNSVSPPDLQTSKAGGAKDLRI
ncbi:Hypp8441 [Branchiostoma lanceolatum]|uniref:Hypp8441 protein n=1 Tax=Branchiostoma lanceolatum TaxID=7740 RepID=A0A8J9Z822_BRALA|nr:Hypp8441 [Branchiostoma lanceolatum]